MQKAIAERGSFEIVQYSESRLRVVFMIISDNKLAWLIKHVEGIEEHLTWIERLLMVKGRAATNFTNTKANTD